MTFDEVKRRLEVLGCGVDGHIDEHRLWLAYVAGLQHGIDLYCAYEGKEVVRQGNESDGPQSREAAALQAEPETATIREQSQ